MKYISRIVAFAILLSATTSFSKEISPSTTNFSAEDYECSFSNGSTVLGRGRITSSRMRSHGSDSFIVRIAFDDATSEFIKQNYGVSNLNRYHGGPVRDFSFELLGPNSSTVMPIEGHYTQRGDWRWVGDINSRKEIFSQVVLNVGVLNGQKFAVDFAVQDEASAQFLLTGIARTSSPLSYKLNGTCD